MPSKRLSTNRTIPSQADPTFREDEASIYANIPRGTLRNRRYRGLPPKFLKPTPNLVLYRQSDLDSWLNESERTITERGK